MKTALWKTAIVTAIVSLATMLSPNWSAEQGVSLSVDSAQARVYGRTVVRGYIAGRPTVIPRYYGGYARGNYYCSYGVGCGYGAENYYASYNMPGFPPSFYGVYGGYSDGVYGRYVNPRYVTGRPVPAPRW